MWSKGKDEVRQLSDSDEDDTEIQRLDDEEGFVELMQRGREYLALRS